MIFHYAIIVFTVAKTIMAVYLYKLSAEHKPCWANMNMTPVSESSGEDVNSRFKNLYLLVIFAGVLGLVGNLFSLGGTLI